MKRSAPHTRTDMPPPHRSQNRSKNKTKNYPPYDQKSIYAAKKRPKPKERRSQRRYKKLNQSQQEIDYLHKHLINLIMLHGKGRLIVGCVAWMTSPIIIEALSHAKAISIIVNDEDYSKWGYGCVKPTSYAVLPGFKVPFGHYWQDKIETPLNVLETVSFQTSIMHQKFLIICNDNDIPTWLWTGSMNFTANAANNQEMGIFIQDEKIALHCFFEFGLTFLESKLLRFSANDEAVIS